MNFYKEFTTLILYKSFDFLLFFERKSKKIPKTLLFKNYPPIVFSVEERNWQRRETEIARRTPRFRRSRFGEPGNWRVDEESFRGDRS